MLRLALVAAVFTSTLAHADYTLPGRQQSRLTLGADGPGCGRDIDCKGDRICTAGVCVDPPPGLAPLVRTDSQTSNVDGNPVHRLLVIEQQLQILELSRPGLGVPIFLTVLGATGVLTGGGLMVVLYWAVALGAVVLGVFLIPLTIGIVTWVLGAGKNSAIDLDVDRLRDERLRLVSTSRPGAEAPQLVELARF